MDLTSWVGWGIILIVTVGLFIYLYISYPRTALAALNETPDWFQQGTKVFVYTGSREYYGTMTCEGNKFLISLNSGTVEKDLTLDEMFYLENPPIRVVINRRDPNWVCVILPYGWKIRSELLTGTKELLNNKGGKT